MARTHDTGLVYIEVTKGFNRFSPDETCIATFLVTVEAGMYLSQFASQPYTYPEQHYPLGAPNGPATETPAESGVWHRTFASGTEVWYDNNDGTYVRVRSLCSPDRDCTTHCGDASDA